jgi:hypothetical protein
MIVRSMATTGLSLIGVEQEMIMIPPLVVIDCHEGPLLMAVPFLSAGRSGPRRGWILNY